MPNHIAVQPKLSDGAEAESIIRLLTKSRGALSGDGTLSNAERWSRQQQPRMKHQAGKKLRRTAYHEAGHAFAYYHYRFPIAHVSITPHGDSLGHIKGLTGFLRGDIESGSLTLHQFQKYENYCVILFAGRASEKQYCRYSTSHGASSDREKARDVAMRLFGSGRCVTAALRLYEVQAEELVKMTLAQWFIPALANYLLEQKVTLTGIEVKALFWKAALERQTAAGTASQNLGS